MIRSKILFACLIALVGWFGYVGVMVLKGQGRLTSTMTIRWSHLDRTRPWVRLSASDLKNNELVLAPNASATILVSVPPRWRSVTFDQINGISIQPQDRRDATTPQNGPVRFADLIPVAGSYRFKLTNSASAPRTISTIMLHVTR